ncbi:MAG: DUF86 domain-containing protein [Syntrophomonadaceae bacterium]|nr:DUF86 domain-containing protein [Syntrophomonadaceae bacterium]
MFNDVIINKVQIIEHCIKRINEEYNGDPANLSNITRQDSIVLNIQRACEAAIALAMHMVAESGWGVPNSSREAFDLLVEHDALEPALANRLKAMVGFRNIAIHDYQKMNMDIIQEIITRHLVDLTDFIESVLHS